MRVNYAAFSSNAGRVKFIAAVNHFETKNGDNPMECERGIFTMYAWSRIASVTALTENPHESFAPGTRGNARTEANYTEVVTPLRGLGSVMRFQRGAVIFRERDHASAIYRVVSGTIALSRITDRRRRIIDFRFAGEFFGSVHRPEHTITAEAASDCVVLSYPRGYVDNMFDELPQFRRALCELLAERVQASGDAVESDTARERIEAFFQSLCGRISGSGELNPPLTCDDIADRLDLSPAAVDCALRALRSEGATPTE